MKNSVIRKIIVVLLSIIFLIQPAFQIFAGIGAVNAWVPLASSTWLCR